MKSSPHSSCSSPSSSAGSSIVNVPDQELPAKPIKVKRSRKTQKLKYQSQNTTTTTAKRSSIYRGVTRHRWTGRFEAHLWDKSSWNTIQNKKGRQVYLGAYDSEEAAARTYDLAALKYWGSETTLNFPIETYATDVEEMMKVSKEEYLASLRRRSSGFSRGVSKYRGVARHHHNGRWEARIGRVFGNKYLYLGTYNTQEEAAAAYDMAAIEHRGPNAVTNFDISNYIDRLKNKGLPLPRVDQSSSDQCGEEEAEVDQKPRHVQENQETMESQEEKEREREMASELEYSEMMCSMDDEKHELSWSFCMEAGGLAPLPLQDSLLPMELPDPFEDSGFEENIDFIFDSPDRNDALLLASSPSSTTTTTLVCCNYSA